MSFREHLSGFQTRHAALSAGRVAKPSSSTKASVKGLGVRRLRPDSCAKTVDGCARFAQLGEDRIDFGGFEFYVWAHIYRLSVFATPAQRK